MLGVRSLRRGICLSCRFRLFHSSEAFSRRAWTSTSARHALPRAYSSKKPSLSSKASRKYSTQHGDDQTDLAESSTPEEMEAVARHARRTFGDTLPDNLLSPGEYALYERLFGPPIRSTSVEDLELLKDYAEEEVEASTNVLLRENEDGELEEVPYGREENLNEMDEDMNEMEVDDVIVAEEEGEAEEVYGGIADENPRGYSERERRAIEQLQRDIAQAQAAEPAVESNAELAEQEMQDESEEREPEDYRDPTFHDESDLPRTHPLTLAGRSGTDPATIQLPKDTFVDPITNLLAESSNKHLVEVSERTFGGTALPYSTATPASRRNLQQKPLALLPTQGKMGEIEADSFLAVIYPGAYAAVTSILVETRKRLGSGWLTGLMEKEGGPTILDVGAGGAGVLAMRDIIRADWEATHDPAAIEDGAPPLGRGSVVVSSDALRKRVSRLLDDTTFLPRLPDLNLKPGTFVEEPREGALPSPQKHYDVVIAPYTLLAIHETHQRKAHLNTLWSLLDPDSGVLVLLEKGLPRGFEAIAGARQMLLDNHIASPALSSTHTETEVQSPEPERYVAKEAGMIVAPCTNHSRCPMYLTPGIKQGRKDFCHFQQRFIRPPFLQRILGETDKNHDDVTFSYVAVQRGRDGRTLPQGNEATDAAFAGPGDADADPMPSPLSLPRAILPPLKRRGHVVLDLCTPSGKLERWTVPKSFGRQAYRDARKSHWGDLWGLGAKTRVEREVRLGDKGGATKKKKKGKQVFEIAEGDDGEGEVREKVGGLRDPRGEKRNRKGRKPKTSRVIDDDEF